MLILAKNLVLRRVIAVLCGEGPTLAKTGRALRKPGPPFSRTTLGKYLPFGRPAGWAGMVAPQPSSQTISTGGVVASNDCLRVLHDLPADGTLQGLSPLAVAVLVTAALQGNS